MQKIKIILILTAIIFLPCILEARSAGMEGDSGTVPKVVCTKPADGEAIDLTGKNEIVFEWSMLPIPSGGREVYKISLLKSDSYGVLFSKTIDPRTFSAKIPSDKFEPGTRYRWYVKQRDARTMVWSQYDNYYFTVVKK